MTCTICTDLVQLADEAILANQTIDDVKNLLYNFCNILVGMEDDCKAFVDENVEKVIDLLVNEYLNPTEICEKLNLCP